MSKPRDAMTVPAQRRAKARRCRAMGRIDEPSERKTAEQIAESHGLSRMHVHRITKELEDWEAQSTFEQEAKDIQDTFPFKHYHPIKWTLVSGRMLLAYCRGEIENPEALLGGKDQSAQIGHPDNDPLLS